MGLLDEQCMVALARRSEANQLSAVSELVRFRLL